MPMSLNAPREFLQKRKLPAPPPSVVSAWDSAEQIENNWYYLDWFGYFFKMLDNEWIFHEKLGWIFADFTTTFESVWMFHESLGWMWTSESAFPYTYNPSTDNWLYLVDLGYYDFNSNAWIAFE